MGLNLLDKFFKKAVNRPIEGVIKADDTADLKLEVEEYVLTDEVERRLETFLEAYNNYAGANGVWISGFFGSGKSHLLKMLAILLENKVIDGTPAEEYFLPKCSDGNEILKGDIRSAVRIPSKSILFNIDQKADVISKTEVDALVAVFVKVFDEACGYYGKQAYIAQFERELDRDNLFVKFKDTFKSIAGQDWEFGRERAKRYANEIDKAYNTATGQTEVNILDKYRNDYHLSIDDFANQVKEYIDKQVPNFRLNFFVDEVGQYIATNEKLMVNLQTVAESLATKCRGRAWVIVTAQNDMSRVLGEMENRLNSDDYTKIQDRFKIRMNLTSADVAEVIQKRLLAKNKEAEAELSVLYKKECDNFKTLFDFADGSQTYKNFQDEKHFIDSYPFIPYQFALFQSAIQNLSKHDAFEGRYSSVGERSMLGVFQKVAIQISSCSIGELATFDLMFEGVRTSLKTGIQNSILKAESHLDNPFAVRVLKALFLVKYIKEFKGTIRNICVLMYPNFNQNLSALTDQVKEALNLLEQQTYIQRTGEVYEYLTDEEKDIEQEIKDTDIDKDDVANELQSLIFDRILGSNKIRYSETNKDYSFSRKLDNKLFSREQELSINIISPLNDNKDAFNEIYYKTFSIQNIHDLIIALDDDYRLVNDLSIYKKTIKYINESHNMQQKESIKRILADKATQNIERQEQIRQRVIELVSKAKFYFNGNEIEVGGDNAKSRIERAFNEMISCVFVNLKMLGTYDYKEEEIGRIIGQKNQGLFNADIVSLSEAEQEVLSYITRNVAKSFRTTVKQVLDDFQKIPYGWSYPAILCNIAKLVSRSKVEIKEDSNILDDADIEKALRSTARQANLILTPQMQFSPSQLRNLKEFYGDFTDEPCSETDAKALALRTGDLLKECLSDVKNTLARESEYPFLKVLYPVVEKLQQAVGKPYSWYLTDFRDISDEILNLKESVIKPVQNFMTGTGRELYNVANKFLATEESNFQYIPNDGVKRIKDLLEDENCYKGVAIQNLQDEVKNLENLIQEKLQEEQKIAHKQIDDLEQKLISMEEYSKISDSDKQNIKGNFSACIVAIETNKLIASVKDMARNFETTTYINCMNEVIRLATPMPEPEVQEVNNVDEKPVQKVEPQVISAKTIKASYSKPLISDENEVNEYINSLKDAYLQQIKDGKRIQI